MFTYLPSGVLSQSWGIPEYVGVAAAAAAVFSSRSCGLIVPGHVAEYTIGDQYVVKRQCITVLYTLGSGAIILSNKPSSSFGVSLPYTHTTVQLTLTACLLLLPCHACQKQQQQQQPHQQPLWWQRTALSGGTTSHQLLTLQSSQLSPLSTHHTASLPHIGTITAFPLRPIIQLSLPTLELSLLSHCQPPYCFPSPHLNYHCFSPVEPSYCFPSQIAMPPWNHNSFSTVEPSKFSHLEGTSTVLPGGTPLYHSLCHLG